MKIKFLLLTLIAGFTLSTATLEAKSYTYSEVHKMPQSVEKDYYIWRFLTQKNTTTREAKAIIQDADRLNKKLKVAYRKKTGKIARLAPKPPLFKTATKDKNAWKQRAQAN